jgi:hypothetical protein
MATSWRVCLMSTSKNRETRMPYWVKRIALKSGERVTERELRRDENRSTDAAPFVGDIITVTCRGRTFRARVVWGNWPDRDLMDKRLEPGVAHLRVEEV